NFKDFERLDLKNTIQDFSGKLTIKYPFHLKIIGPYDFTILNEIDIILNEKKESILTNQLFNSLNNSNPIEIKSYKEENLEIDIKSTGGIIMYANITDDKYSKIRAYCFFILNNFETVLESNNRNLIEGWNNYFKALYKNSSDFKMVVEDSISIKYRDQFTESFITKIEQLRDKALQNQ
ncbi:MAG: hypothetical protein ACXWV5_02595, partial [Flavitalea sp.]